MSFKVDPSLRKKGVTFGAIYKKVVLGDQLILPQHYHAHCCHSTTLHTRACKTRWPQWTVISKYATYVARSLLNGRVISANVRVVDVVVLLVVNHSAVFLVSDQNVDALQVNGCRPALLQLHAAWYINKRTRTILGASQKLLYRKVRENGVRLFKKKGDAALRTSFVFTQSLPHPETVASWLAWTVSLGDGSCTKAICCDFTNGFSTCNTDKAHAKNLSPLWFPEFW